MSLFSQCNLIGGSCGGGGGWLWVFGWFVFLFDVENAKEKLGKMKEWNDTVLELRVHFYISFVC